MPISIANGIISSDPGNEMTFITNACLYSQTPITGWIQVNSVDLGNGLTGFKNFDNKYASARAAGDIIWVDSPGLNETFEVKDGLAKVVIGEGPRVIKVA